MYGVTDTNFSVLLRRALIRTLGGSAFDPSNIETNKPSLERHAKAEFLLERDSPVRDQVIAGIPAAVPG